MERVIIPIYFDYASTLCYIAWRIVSELESELGFESLWKGVPISIRDFKARAGSELGPREYQKVIMVAAETGIRVAPPKTWINSDAALMGAELAREAKVFPPITPRFFAAPLTKASIFPIPRCWPTSRIAPAWIARALWRICKANGWHRASLTISARPMGNRRSVIRPFILGEFPLIGIQPKDTMRLIFARYMRQREENPGN